MDDSYDGDDSCPNCDGKNGHCEQWCLDEVNDALLGEILFPTPPGEFFRNIQDEEKVDTLRDESLTQMMKTYEEKAADNKQ